MAVNDVMDIKLLYRHGAGEAAFFVPGFEQMKILYTLTYLANIPNVMLAGSDQ